MNSISARAMSAASIDHPSGEDAGERWPGIAIPLIETAEGCLGGAEDDVDTRPPVAKVRHRKSRSEPRPQGHEGRRAVGQLVGQESTAQRRRASRGQERRYFYYQAGGGLASVPYCWNLP